MLASKSVMDLIVSKSRESSFVNIHHLSYPFISSLDIGDLDLESAQEVVADICDWLDVTIGPIPKWGISRLLSSWGPNDKINITFLFKTEEDAVAFKLRWM